MNSNMVFRQICLSFGFAAACGFASLAATTQVTDDMTATGDWPIEVASGDTVEVTAQQTGSGKIIKTGAGILSLKVGNTFSGGVEIQAGRVRAEADTALGSGTVTIAAPGTSICELDVIGAGKGETFSRTIANAINVTGKPTIAYPAIRSYGQNNVMSGSITASEDFALCEDHQSVKAISSTDWSRYQSVKSMTFSGTITVAGTFFCDGWCKMYYNGKITASTFDLSVTSSEGSNHNGQYYLATANEIGTIKFGRHYVDFTGVGGAGGAFLQWPATGNPDRAAVAVGKNQSIGGISSALTGQPTTATDIWIFGYGSSYSASTVTVTGVPPEEGETTREVATSVSVNNKVSLVLDAYEGFTQTFHNRANTTTGSITVKKGTFKVTGEATFAKVTKVSVDDTFVAECQPFADGSVDLTLGKDASFSIPADAEWSVKTLTVDGQQKAPGRYSSKRLPQLASGSFFVLTGPAAGIEDVTWTGGGEADTKITTGDNWEYEIDLQAGNIRPTFAMGGAVASFDSDAIFAGLRFQTPSTSSGFSLDPYDGRGSITLTGTEITIADADVDRAADYAVNVPVTRQVTDVIDIVIPTNKTLTIGSGITTTGGLHIKDPRSGTMIFDGESTVANQVAFGTGTTIRVKGTIATPNHASQGTARENTGKCIYFEPGGVSKTAIELENGRIEKPIYLASDSPTYPILALAGTTNTLAGDVRFYGGSWTGFKAEEGALLSLEGGAHRSGNGMYLSGPGTIRVATTSIMASHSSNGARLLNGGTLVFEAPSNDFTYFCLGNGNNSTDERVECKVSNVFSGNSGVALLNGYQPASPRTKGTAVMEFNATTQKVSTVYGSKIATFRGDAGSLLVAVGNQQEDAKGNPVKTLSNRFIASKIEGGLSLMMGGTGTMLLANQTFTTTGDLIVTNGVLELAADASWANGTNVVVSGNGCLKLNARANLNKTAAKLQVSDNGTVDIPAGRCVTVAEAWVGGVRLEDGDYVRSADNAWLSGDGTLRVGASGIMLIVR